MSIDEINIGDRFEDTLGKATYSKKGNLMKERAKREVVVTNKTSNSIEYKDKGRYSSWITFEDFIRIENSTKRVRFEKVI